MQVPLDARNSDDAFVLDAGSEVFVWVGKDATKQEAMMSMVHAQVRWFEFEPDTQQSNFVVIHCLQSTAVA